jgi:YesN/AraC family two-component response regulator
MRKQLLIVEDEPIIALDIKEILEKEGYHCITDVESVDKAIQLIESTSFALVLLDINLKKDKDGIDLASYLLKKDNVPFVFLTSYTDKITLERAKETRPYGYIVKPFKPIDLITTVQIVINNFIYRNIDVTRKQEIINNDSPFIIKKVTNYINEHIEDKINIDDLVKLTKWQSQHFQKMFKKFMGVTVYKYILNKKIEKAQMLLLQETTDITQISFNLGFKSHSNFCFIFKKHIGLTPKEFRKINEAKKFY